MKNEANSYVRYKFMYIFAFLAATLLRIIPVYEIFDYILVIIQIFALYKMMKTKKTKNIRYAFYFLIGTIAIVIIMALITSMTLTAETFINLEAIATLFVILTMIPRIISDIYLIRQFTEDTPTGPFEKLGKITILCGIIMTLTAILYFVWPRLLTFTSQLYSFMFVITISYSAYLTHQQM